jgi:hypothetical protein
MLFLSHERSNWKYAFLLLGIIGFLLIKSWLPANAIVKAAEFAAAPVQQEIAVVVRNKARSFGRKSY